MIRRSVAEARDTLSELIRLALAGEEVVITHRGLPVVELKAVRPQARPMNLEDIERLRQGRVGRRIADLNAGDLVSRMRDDDDERLLRR